MKRMSAGGSTIQAPELEGDYRLYLIDVAGNVSEPSAYKLTVDNTVPSNQNSIFPSQWMVTHGTAITLSGTLNPGETIWIAPATATQFIQGMTMTLSTTLTITVPQMIADYKLFVVDAAGNVSLPSDHNLSVQ